MNIELSIPQGYEDITIREYKELRRIIGSNRTEQEKSLDIIRTLCRVDSKDLKRVQHSDMQNVMGMLSWVFDEPGTRQELIRKFELNGKVYGFIPNMSRLTIAEFADLDTYSENGYDNLEHIMSVLYRPVCLEIRDFYEIEPYDNTRHHYSIMEDMPMNVAMSAMVFFYNIERALAVDTHNYSARVSRVG